MSETRINISELKSEGSDLVKELVALLKEKTNSKIETETNEIVVKSGEENVSRLYLRVLLRKFLHKKELRDTFRVIGGKENTLIVKQKKTAEED